jgi:hypothetical protein
MNIAEAYHRGLIKVGRRIITNGNGESNRGLTGDEIKITGIIVSLSKNYFCVNGEYDNISSNKKTKVQSWCISYSNTIAYIKFIENTKKISLYTYWLIQNNL